MSDTPNYTIRTWEDAGAFLQHAEPWLLANEAEHNLVIGIARQIQGGTSLFQAPIYLASVELDGDIVGCAFRTPPHKLGLTRMPHDAIPALVEDIERFYAAIPAVLGEAALASRVAQLWVQRNGGTARPGMKHRIYQLDSVEPPSQLPPGNARLATLKDANLVASWITAFSEEADIHTDNAHGLAVARIRQHALYLWEDGAIPVAMAAWSGETPHGRRVGYVYTPPAHRRRGYATALVAHLSQRILDDGCRFCFLYTDLDNPTSNSIYQHIGYRPVCDVMDWVIEQPENS